MEPVGVESAGRFLKDRNFGDLEIIFSSFFLFHAICVTPTAHSLGAKSSLSKPRELFC